MAQTPALKHQGCEKTIDYTPGSAVTAGDVVVLGNIPWFAPQDITANVKGVLTREGLWKAPKITGAIAAGADVFWNPTGDPVTGTAGSGGATANFVSGSYYLGQCVLAALSGDTYVTVAPLGTGPARLPVNTVAAAGNAQGNAAQLYEGFNLVSGADDTKGVILPAAAAGKVVIIKVGDGADLKVYPATGDTINALSANAAITVVDDVCFMLVAYDSTTWYTLPLLPS